MSGSLPLAVDARHLTHRYNQFTAVDDVTLQVRPGETMGLLGPNGAGKTTMVRMLTTLTPVQQGELRIFGMDARHQTTDIRSNIGYVPQQLSIEPALTGRQNVEWFARLYGVPRAQRAERVDEALAALDPIARDGVWTQVQKMQSQFGMTVLLTTHYMEEADALCDRVALMHRGQLRAVGTPDKLKSTVSPGASLEDVFRHYAASGLDDQSESGSSIRETRTTRKVARRVG
jgi:ABC-2 type transport system ATP-binding protein